MTTLPTITFVNSDLTLFLLPSPEAQIRAVRIQGISFLLAKSAFDVGLCPFGISLKSEGKMEVVYELQPQEGELENQIGKLAAKFCNETSNERSGNNLTQIVAIGHLSLYSEWVTLLESWRLPEGIFIANEIKRELGVSSLNTSYEPPSPPIDGSREYQNKYNTFHKVLGGNDTSSPVHYYSLPISLGPTPSREEKIEKREASKPHVDLSKQRVMTVSDFMNASSGFESDREIDVRNLIMRANQIGEEPTTVKVTGHSHYATQGDWDLHVEKSKAYDPSFSRREVDAIIEHFSFLKTKTFYQGRDEAKKQGMDLWVERIEGYPRNKYSNIRPYQMCVTIRDTNPKNGSCPSLEGIIVDITGLVGVNPTY